VKIEISRGVGGIKYVKIVEKCRLQDPRAGFSIKEYVIERRRDPLTGKWCRINVERALRERRVEEKEIDESVRKVFDEYSSSCPFCSSRIESQTPKFEEGDRIYHGKVIIMPNLYPFAETHAIGVIDPDRHVTDVSDICDYIVDIIEGSITYFRRLGFRYRYHYINMNFLFPAGSSIPHAHIQIFATEYPSVYHEDILRRSVKYYDKYCRNMMVDYLLSEIQNSSRLILASEDTVTFAAYCPRSYNEVHILHMYEHDILSLDKKGVDSLAEPICRVLRGFRNILLQRTFNFAILSTSRKKHSKHFRIMVRLCTRKEPVPYYTNDIGFIELLHEEPVIITYPEETAKKLRHGT